MATTIWPYRVDPGTNTTSATVWAYWTTASATTTSTIQIQDNVWTTWQNSTATTLYPQRYFSSNDPYADETDEEREARLERQAAQVEQYRRKERRARIRAQIATLRAQRLLASILSKEQAEEYEAKRSFHVQVRDPRDRRFRSFRINHGTSGNVTELDENGRARYKYCIHPSGVPTEDTMIAQLLMLQDDIAEFERIANRSLVHGVY